VTLQGTLQNRSTAAALLRAVEAVITVEDHLRYRWDDTDPVPPTYL
jgi:hypothetical protein